MPLKKSASKSAFSSNVSEMVHAGHPLKQALAAAYSTQRKARRDSTVVPTDIQKTYRKPKRR